MTKAQLTKKIQAEKIKRDELKNKLKKTMPIGKKGVQEKIKVCVVKIKELEAELKSMNKTALKEAAIMNRINVYLTEGEMENAEAALAAKDLVDRLQDMVEDLGKMTNEELPALVDAIRNSFGGDPATQYQASANAQLNTLLTAVKTTKDELNNSTLVLTGDASQAPNDGDVDNTANPSEDGQAGDDVESDEGSLDKLADQSGEDEEDGFDALPAASGSSPLGRERRTAEESRSSDLYKAYKLTESKNLMETVESIKRQLEIQKKSLATTKADMKNASTPTKKAACKKQETFIKGVIAKLQAKFKEAQKDAKKLKESVVVEAKKGKKPEWLEKKEVDAEEKEGKKVSKKEKEKVDESEGKNKCKWCEKKTDKTYCSKKCKDEDQSRKEYADSQKDYWAKDKKKVTEAVTKKCPKCKKPMKDCICGKKKTKKEKVEESYQNTLRLANLLGQKLGVEPSSKKKVTEDSDWKTLDTFVVSIPANVYDGKYYDFRVVPVTLAKGADGVETEQDAIDWINSHKDTVIAQCDSRYINVGDRKVRRVKKPAAKNMFFKPTYHVTKSKVTSKGNQINESTDLVDDWCSNCYGENPEMKNCRACKGTGINSARKVKPTTKTDAADWARNSKKKVTEVFDKNNEHFEGQAPYECDYKIVSGRNVGQLSGLKGIVADDNASAIAKSLQWVDYVNNLPGAIKNGLKVELHHVYNMFRDDYMNEPFEIYPEEKDFGRDIYPEGLPKGHPQYKESSNIVESTPKNMADWKKISEALADTFAETQEYTAYFKDESNGATTSKTFNGTSLDEVEEQADEYVNYINAKGRTQISLLDIHNNEHDINGTAEGNNTRLPSQVNNFNKERER